jgi:hypothetical protein
MSDDISPTVSEKTKKSSEQLAPVPPVKTARSRNKALLDKEMERQMISKLHEILCESKCFAQFLNFTGSLFCSRVYDASTQV